MFSLIFVLCSAGAGFWLGYTFAPQMGLSAWFGGTLGYFAGCLLVAVVDVIRTNISRRHSGLSPRAKMILEMVGIMFTIIFFSALIGLSPDRTVTGGAGTGFALGLIACVIYWRRRRSQDQNNAS